MSNNRDDNKVANMKKLLLLDSQSTVDIFLQHRVVKQHSENRRSYHFKDKHIQQKGQC